MFIVFSTTCQGTFACDSDISQHIAIRVSLQGLGYSAIQKAKRLVSPQGEATCVLARRSDWCPRK
eukprot:6998760-Alexandrium_andersonii.AAC.1